jgi:hypothetical protein
MSFFFPFDALASENSDNYSSLCKGCHAITTPLPHSVKYILFNSGLPDNFHFIDEK